MHRTSIIATYSGPLLINGSIFNSIQFNFYINQLRALRFYMIGWLSWVQTSDLLNSVSCRPYYVSTTTSTPRDVVVVMETSASIRGEYLFEAKHAALTVMESMGVNDRVSGSNCLLRTRKTEESKVSSKGFLRWNCARNVPTLKHICVHRAKLQP